MRRPCTCCCACPALAQVGGLHQALSAQSSASALTSPLKGLSSKSCQRCIILQWNYTAGFHPAIAAIFPSVSLPGERTNRYSAIT